MCAMKAIKAKYGATNLCFCGLGFTAVTWIRRCHLAVVCLGPLSVPLLPVSSLPTFLTFYSLSVTMAMTI